MHTQRPTWRTIMDTFHAVGLSTVESAGKQIHCTIKGLTEPRKQILRIPFFRRGSMALDSSQPVEAVYKWLWCCCVQPSGRKGVRQKALHSLNSWLWWPSGLVDVVQVSPLVHVSLFYSLLSRVRRRSSASVRGQRCALRHHHSSCRASSRGSHSCHHGVPWRTR